MRAVAHVIIGASFIAFAGCTALIGLPDLPDAASADGAPSDGGPSDAGPDSSDGKASCTAIASVGTVQSATGLSMQSHVVFAQHAGTWWLFYIDSANANQLGTRYSTDFCNWNDGASLSLPYVHGNEGRNFGVSYTDLGGQDVIHISLSHLVDSTHRYHTHTRAHITGTTIVFDSTSTVSSYTTSPSYPIDPDGPVTVVGSDGFVTDMSGWVDEGTGHIADATMWRSTTADNGASWTNAWGPFDVVTYVSNVVNARAGVPLIAGGILATWENGSQEPDPNNVGFSVWNGSTWSSVGMVFGALTPQGVNDWALFAISPTNVHAVRRTLATSSFEHVRFNGTSWAAGAAMPEDTGVLDTGLFLAGTVNDVSAYAIASNPPAIRTSTWNGASWTAWSTFHTSSNACSSLSGYASPTAGKAALIWTELVGQVYEIHGVELL